MSQEYDKRFYYWKNNKYTEQEIIDYIDNDVSRGLVRDIEVSEFIREFYIKVLFGL